MNRAASASMDTDRATRKEQDDPADRLSPRVLAPLGDVESYLADLLGHLDAPDNLREAVGYALLGGGKRLRPLLCIHCARAVGGTTEDALPAAAAVEMIHAFSLIHDDLPALDNDDLRRGRPTLHVRFGEAMAVLAGDALMSLAFQLLADRIEEPRLVGELVGELARGTTNMIAGQVLDTLGGFPETVAEEHRPRLVHENKTGALFRAACRMGALAGVAGRQRRAQPAPNHLDQIDAVTALGEALGLMFQIVDDLIDVEQSAEHTGKRVAKDEHAGKITYPAVLGVDGSRAEIDRLRAASLDALDRLAAFPDARTHELAELCEYLALRTR